MKLKGILVSCIVAAFFMGFVVSHAEAVTYPWLKAGSYDANQSIEKRIPAPEGFTRVQVPEGSFAAWLRGLPLMPEGAPVRVYPVSKGKLKIRSWVHYAVVNMDVLRFQQCADAIMRLRAEYQWSTGKADNICFNFTSGDICCWRKWKEGSRPVVSGNKVVWKNSGSKVSTRNAFMAYLDMVMLYAGSASLSRELINISPAQLKIGDVIIQGGSPGHAIMVLDMAKDDCGDKVMLLGQSFMPSQEFHVLNNPEDNSSPWYKVKTKGILTTPEWRFDLVNDCRRFVGDSSEAQQAESEPQADEEDTLIKRVNAQLRELEPNVKNGWSDSIDKQIKELATRYKKNPVILQNIGSWCSNQKNNEKAFEILCRAALASRLKGLECNRDEALNQIIKMNQTMTLEKLKNSSRCIPVLEGLRRENPYLLTLGAYVFLAQYYFETGKPENEMEVYLSATGPFFEEAELHYNLAKLLLKAGRTKDAIVEFQWAVNVDPAHPRLKEISFEMFPVMDSTGSRCKNDPDFESTNIELCTFLDGYEYMTSGPIHMAVPKLEECARQNPKEPLYHLYLGELYGKRGEHEDAYGELRKTLTALTGRTSSFYRGELELGDAAYRTRGVDSAKKWWTTVAKESRVPWVREQAEERLKAVGGL